MKNKNGILYWVTYILMILIILAQSLISYEIEDALNYVYLIWLVFAFILIFRERDIDKKRYTLLFIFSAYYYLSLVSILGPNLAMKKLFVFLTSLSPILMYDIFTHFGYKKKTFLVVVLIIVAILNGIYLYSITLISGELGLKVMHDETLEFKNSFNIVYAYSILLPSLVYLLIRFNDIIKSKYNNIVFYVLGVTFTLLVLYIVLASYYMTAIVVSLFSCGLVFLFKKNHWVVKSVIAFGIIILIFNLTYELFVDYARESNMSSIITFRMEELHNIFTGNNSSNIDITSRQDLTHNSFDTFIHNPIFGVLHKSTDFQMAVKMGVGQHSEWIDMLGMYGLFAIFLLLFIYESMKNISRDLGTYFIFIPYVIIGFLNPVFSFIQNLFVFLFIPFLYQCILGNDKKFENKLI